MQEQKTEWIDAFTGKPLVDWICQDCQEIKSYTVGGRPNNDNTKTCLLCITYKVTD